MKKNKLTIIKYPRLYSDGGYSIPGTVASAFIPSLESTSTISRRALRGYDLGGTLELAAVAGKQTASAIGDITQVGDRAKAVEEDLKSNVTNPAPSASTDELLNKWASWNPTSHISWRDLTNKGTFASYASDILGNSTEGAAAGAKLGPIGAIAGAANGIVNGIAGNLFAGIKARKKAKKINKRIDAQNLNTQDAFSNQANLLDDEMTNNALSNFTGWEYAKGGHLFQDGGNKKILPDFFGLFPFSKELPYRVISEEEEIVPNPQTGKFDLRRVDFHNYKSKFNRGFIPDSIERIQDSLIYNRIGFPQRMAILASVLHESGGDPKAKSSSGNYKGILQWGKDRQEGKDLGSQINQIIGTSRDVSSPNWTHGGSGFPHTKNAQHAYDSFWDEHVTPYMAAAYFNKGYVRPKEEQARINRSKEALNMARVARELPQKPPYKTQITPPSENTASTWYGMPINPIFMKKSFGGDLMTHGANFDTGLTFIDNGGTHEENPYGGVFMGIGMDGVPNLVEEGEVIFNDYVFSKRLKVPKVIKNKYKLRGTKPLSFADAAIQMSKESEERPNDPISQAGLEDGIYKLMMAQEQVRAAKAEGTEYAKGGLIRKYGNAGYLNLKIPTLDDYFESKKQTNTPFNVDLPNFTKLTTPVPKLQNVIPDTNLATLKSEVPLASGETKDNKQDFLRYAPIINSGVQTLTDALGFTNRPEYKLGKEIRKANNQLRDISTRNAGQKMAYKPTDMWSAVNNFNAQMAAQRSALRNASNRVGVTGQLLASAYNQNKALGDLYAGMEKANWDRLTNTITHNNQVDMANRQAELHAAQVNANIDNIRAQNLIRAAQADDAEESAYAQARATNRDNFINSLGLLGKEKIDRAMLEGLINSGILGTPNESMLQALSLLGIKQNKG